MTDTRMDGDLRRDGDRCAVRFERLYDATAEELWAALTDPERLAGWLAHVSRFELVPAGDVEIDFGDSEEERVSGRIRTLEHERVLEYTWTYPGESESVVRFEIVPREHGVLLVLDHRQLSWEAAAGYGAGWQAHLDVLGAHLSGQTLAWADRYRELRPHYDEQLAALESER